LKDRDHDRDEQGVDDDAPALALTLVGVVGLTLLAAGANVALSPDRPSE
jgi:hypothetical protein